jgi:SAM-dependent methyltransferase
MTMDNSKSLDRQRERYDREALLHHEHYQDKWTQRYRDIFYRSHFADIDLKGKDVLDAMCASGIETSYLLSRGAHVTGVDISSENAALFEKRWDLKCNVESIHETSFSNGQFDIVYIMGGLHHVLPLLTETIEEVHRILKPGGYFFFIEPNKDTWANIIRSFWYKHSSRFADEEEAISYKKQLKPYLTDNFEENVFVTGGNFAYLIIGQSLVLKVPKVMKRILAPFLFFMEKLLTPLPFVPKLFFAGVWRKI